MSFPQLGLSLPIPRLALRFQRPNKVSRSKGYFLDGRNEHDFVRFRWLVEAGNLPYEL